MTPKANFTPVHLLSGMPQNTPVLLALSGGADSRALLDMLLEYRKESGAEISVAHVNHMIRGKDAERDRDFCRQLAEKHSLPFYLLEADVPALAKANGRGLEEEAREVRYDFFRQVMQKENIPILATAHNATDNAETVIFNLVRGSGARGLCGIPPVREFEGGKIVRPILNMSKESVISYCREHGLDYVTDGTNSDVTYSRNRIRNNVLPELREINPNAVENISRACELLTADNSFIESVAKEFVSSLEDRCKIPIDRFTALDKAVGARITASLLGEYFQVSAVHIEAFMGLAAAAVPHSSLTFPNEITARVENGNIEIIKNASCQKAADFTAKIELGENSVPNIDGIILAENSDNTENLSKKHIYLQNIYKNSTTALVNFDRISNGLYIRPRAEGDKILVGGMHKKLKKLFCDKKIPLERRASTPIFYSEDAIVWVPGVALSDCEKKAKNKVKLTFYYN